ncbi:DUF6627 family protein [Marinobacterium arenosum]|uniref:DUF6627 family protein n=1 Tax=Marinobacterium arenosum TaxID=2862496 RepID=UPI001C95417E|nr:DUF6627 family protein [Marinobacterium arenosum]MBY4675076.1 PA2779 family protein [Marinobacterium arenosum]
MMNTRRLIATLLISLLSLLQVPMTQAAMLATDQALQSEARQLDRTELLSMLEKEQVRSQLEAYGVDPQQAQARVNSMTDAELAMLNQQLEQLPAGQGVIGVAVLLFIVFIVTDALGATDLFTFVKPINR